MDPPEQEKGEEHNAETSSDELRVYPRIGDQHQVEIPNMATEAESVQLILSSTDNNNIIGFDYTFGLGLPIPIVCIQNSSHQNVEYSLLPNSPTSTWSDAEAQSFLLGLYIFGKNLIQLRKFLGSKTMGDILSYYYGKFYGSDAYCKWSQCRKIKSRRGIIGQRIFTSWRQQELLSRLMPTIPIEAQHLLSEVIKTFNERNSSFEEFIFALKSTVGMQLLAEAIGIGKGKTDLTKARSDPSRRNNQTSYTPSEMPIGKACSSLTPKDIIRFLTGGYRISKARSNDLFWEAVWPRLLARGWHSEQPKDQLIAGSKSTLVFLIPGIKKFSRKKHKRGNHYFDSVSDVLSKVTSDPRLLELDVEEVTGNKVDNKLDQKVHPDDHLCGYLQPKLQICNSGLTKFTIVDTSLAQGEGPFKVREMRDFPVDATFKYEPSNHFGKSQSNSSEEQYSSDVSSSGSEVGTDQDISGDGNIAAVSSQTIPICANVPGNPCLDVLNDTSSLKDIKCQLKQRAKSRQQVYLAPVSKRRRLAAAKYEEAAHHSFSSSEGHQLTEGTKNERGLPEDSKESAQDEKKREESEKKPLARALFDLNLPYVLPDNETNENLCMPLDNQDEQNKDKGASLGERAKEELSGGQSLLSSQRQSTRTRPPTRRALEALASGLLGTKRRGKGMKAA
ncbi:uncharacterized protein LOC109708502 [Ananas comosus]|uniref:Uncharacterized protein LOC109708502 n=1 Tax=Ananas comosus TaxID=4615 RepID=A0A6P5EQP9_ANACO|nr:uncharacterized protein LOC109708502 [Ananas comosus]XP_020085864.1 uncharacterized protein LOC109708502 [Ananas comosus]